MGERDFSVGQGGGTKPQDIGYGEGGGDVRDYGGYLEQAAQSGKNPPQPLNSAPQPAAAKKTNPEGGAPTSTPNLYLEQQWQGEQNAGEGQSWTPVNTGSGGTRGGNGGGS